MLRGLFGKIKDKLAGMQTEYSGALKADATGKKVSLTDFGFCLLVTWALVFVVEILSRHSLVGAVKFMVLDFKYFVMNFSIALCFVTLCLFFKRKYFALTLALILWLTLGVANCIVLMFRNTPLAWVDFSILRFAIDIMDAYINWWQLIGICLLIALGIALIILAFRYTPKCKPNYLSAAVWQLVAVALCVAAMALSYNIYKTPESFGNLPKAYKKYGFVYCFSCSTVNRGVDKTEYYTEEEVDALISKISRADKAKDVKVKPNIIYLQLESFFDVKYLKDVQYNQDPIPVFTKLKEQNPSGFLKIPGLGGGTANSEFEVLTGMSVGMFGACEYPYKTITLKHTAGSVCYDLKNYGYSTHAVHNHTSTFYDRHINYTNIGFDTFTSVEYMGEVERTPTGWAKDRVLIDEIFKCLDATEERDFVFAVSVQGHGKYPKEVLQENQPITVTSGMEDDEAYKIGFEYYINQLYEMDTFIDQLITALESYDEPTVLVLYGDHLPAMSFEEEQLINESLYETEYVIWSNYNIPTKADEYLYAYQLNSRVTELLGFKGNYVNALHRYYKNDVENEAYRKELQTLMYDELYGKNYAYDGETPYLKTQMTFGPDPANPMVLDEEKSSLFNFFKYPDEDKEEQE